MKPRKLALFVLALAFAVIGVWRGPALWTWATTEVVYQINLGRVGEHRFHRWRKDEFGRRVQFHSRVWNESGVLINDSKFIIMQFTRFEGDGTVMNQSYFDGTGSVELTEPPWLWGVKDQTESTAPWVLVGKSQEEWWRSLPEEKKWRP